MNNRLLSFGGKKALARAEGRGTMTEDGGQKTEGRHGGISNAEGGKRMEDGHLRVYTRSLLQRREKPQIPANPEPL